ncbi:aldolase/citrate lyase family protein [Uliginosibacterium sp. sgz301328]|uniref:aldolase/citrate lyase family protein n=1 Tax=Uliginosibacterium sp. sgz301328 TaxID=3243764 RepID=UPI00359D1AF2
MDMPINTFKRAIVERKRQIGLWSHLSSYVSMEVIAGAGFDWILIDMEHSPNELFQVHQQLLAMAEYATQPVVRVAWNDKVMIKRVIDIGAQTILVPYVQNADEARAAVAATRYPSGAGGLRGFTAQSRASRFGRVKDYHQRAAQEMCVIVQVETREALDNIEAIAAVDGVDGVFIGPGDLSASLGFLGDAGHADVQRVVIESIDRIVAAGKPAGILTGDRSLAKNYIERGCTFAAVGADIALLARAAEQLAQEFGCASGARR